MPHIVDMRSSGDSNFLTAIAATEGKRAIEESRSIRTTALRYKVAYFTTIAGARASCNALAHLNKLSVHSLQSLHARAG